MKFHKTPIALAVIAACGALPLAAQAAPTVSWNAPMNGAALSGNVSGGACAVTTSSDTDRVTFWADNWQINNDYSPPFNCDFPTTQLRDGPYTLRAVAYDASGASTEARIRITVNNSGSATPTPTVTPTPTPVSSTATPAPTSGTLDVWFKAPLAGSTVKSQLNAGTSCYVNASGSVSRVQFLMDGTAFNTDSTVSDGMQCVLDTTKFANGSHQLTATAYDPSGAWRSDVITINVQNVATVTPTPAVTPTPSATSSTPVPGSGTLDVWFKAPLARSTVKGQLNGGTGCYVNGTGVTRVAFFLDSTALNTDTTMADGMQCVLDTTKFANGTHQLTATAYDASGKSRSDVITVNVQNPATPAPVVTPTVTPTPSATSSTPVPGSGALDVWFKAPPAGSTVKGQLNGGTGCYVNGTGVTRVAFFLDGTALNTDTTMADGMQCVLDTTKFANGTHQLKATAYAADGSSRVDVINVNVRNASATPTPTVTPSPTVNPTPTVTPAPVQGISGLPINGASGVATFESIGLYWKPSTNPGAAGCSVIFRKQGDSAFRQGLDMWYDATNSECRGSLVQLEPGTTYEVQIGLAGQSPSAGIAVTTWSEQFPVAQVITLRAGVVTQPLAVTQGGTANGYVVYQADPAGTTIDVQNAFRNNVTVAAPYVIVRGLTLKGAQADAIDLLSGAHDVVIEGNDISGWGRFRSTGNWDYGVDYDAGVRCEKAATLERAIIQRNKIHDPRYGANSWDSLHPAGPQGISFNYCGGNHVMRYNEVTSADSKHFYNDGIGGSDNYTRAGFPNYDSDIYGNVIQGVMDDGIESEGGNRNVRIWGNYIDQAGTGIATTVASVGPVYIFRNVYNRSRMRYLTSLDADDRGPFFKSGTDTTVGNGRRYVFHNTSLQPTAAGASFGLGAGSGIHGTGGNPLTNTVSRNNIYNIWKSAWDSVDQTAGGFGNDADYDLYNGTINAGAGAEANGVRTTPIYAGGNGVGMSGQYQLAPGSAGHGKGARIPNFNDDVATPDVGAHQSGKPAMTFGVNGTR